MTSTNVIEAESKTQWSLDYPRVRELWRTINEAYITIADAIEEVARAGVPAEVVATTASVPLREVKLILKDAAADEEVKERLTLASGWVERDEREPTAAIRSEASRGRLLAVSGALR